MPSLPTSRSNSPLLPSHRVGLEPRSVTPPAMMSSPVVRPTVPPAVPPNEDDPDLVSPDQPPLQAFASKQNQVRLLPSPSQQGRTKRAQLMRNMFRLAHSNEEPQKKFLLTIKILFVCLQQEEQDDCEPTSSEAVLLRQRAKTIVERCMSRHKRSPDHHDVDNNDSSLQQDIQKRLISVVGLDRWAHAQSSCNCYWEQLMGQAATRQQSEPVHP